MKLKYLGFIFIFALIVGMGQNKRYKTICGRKFIYEEKIVHYEDIFMDCNVASFISLKTKKTIFGYHLKKSINDTIFIDYKITEMKDSLKIVDYYNHNIYYYDSTVRNIRFITKNKFESNTVGYRKGIKKVLVKDFKSSY